MSAGGSSGGGEKFCLKWNEFESNVSTAFRELRDDKDFFDVTLACEGNQLEAHKVILSACSPFFRSVLKRNPHTHPLLYLKGIKYEDVLAVLNFMYHGEVNIAQDELNSFLAVAEDLQVKGLTQNGGTPSSNPKRPAPQPEPPRPPKQQQMRPAPAPARSTYETPEVQQQSTHMEVTEVVGNNIKTEPQQQVVDLGGEEESGVVEYGEEEEYQYGGQDYAYQDDMHHGLGEAGAAGQEDRNILQTYIIRPEGGASGFQCSICGKNMALKHNLLNHVENIHFPGTFMYKCHICLKELKSKESLNNHHKSAHKMQSQSQSHSLKLL